MLASRKINASGVPEHFNLPWNLFSEEQPLEGQGIELAWHSCPGGTGEMLAKLRAKELDAAVLLTEGAVTDILQGSDLRIVDFYVNSPLTWGVHCHAKQTIDPKDIADKSFAISRYKSGSHLMAYVFADNKNVSLNNEDFTLVKDLEGARKALKEGKADLFLWEKFTTRYLVDSGEFKLIDICPTPWPSFVLVARSEFLEAHSDELAMLHSTVQDYCARCQNDVTTPTLLTKRFELSHASASAWFSEVSWNTRPTDDWSALQDVKDRLYELGIIDTEQYQSPIDALLANEFIGSHLLQLG